MRLLFAVLVTVFSSVSHAIYFPLPAGHREAFMGNVGGAMEASPGNALYNPAGLGFRSTNKLSLSVSGTALTSHEMKSEKSDLSPSDYSVRPLMAAGIYPTSMGTVAVFVASPMMLSLGGFVDTQDGVYSTSSLSSMDSQLLKVGAAFGSSHGDSFSWGISSGVQLGNSKTHTYSKVRTGGNLYASVFAETESKMKGVFVLPGVQVKPMANWTVGFSAQFIPVMLESKSVEYTAVHYAATPNTVNEETDSFTPVNESPYYLRFANGFNLMAGNDVFVDVTYSSESSMNDSDGKVETDEAFFMYSIGWRNKSFESWQPMAGYNYSALESATNHLSSAGVAFVRGRSELILGGYYMASVPKEANSRFEYSSYGFMFSSNVAY
ncbi:hypothetical protein EZJ49_13830 [Bdellovibrio bacteriovorus]|uniref:hypothetical protein n=1 Tax=Bdellovibrio bacteriovorus TaxID=959 RepID=UPI0021D176F0|nr:hypothetical protein [Bdellovibrio bacteriovorus]UXR64141.1 hypothetical protein EZJ49_13830 [Bdellovibrio bacteriovorus]